MTAEPMAARPHVIIAYTAEDDRYAHLRVAAEEQARSAGARLILYNIDAAGMFSAPLPNEWDGQDASELFGDLLSPEDLERAGRQEFAGQVRDARAAGVEAWGWLPSKKGADGLAEYAARQEADLIMLPADMEEAGLMDRLRGATVDAAADKVQRPIAVVDESGGIEYR